MKNLLGIQPSTCIFYQNLFEPKKEKRFWVLFKDIFRIIIIILRCQKMPLKLIYFEQIKLHIYKEFVLSKHTIFLK
jgi:hypothetical protein